MGDAKQLRRNFFVEHLWANHLYGMPFFVRHSDSQPGGGRAIWHFYHGHQRNGHFPFHCLLWHVQFQVSDAHEKYTQSCYIRSRAYTVALASAVCMVFTLAGALRAENAYSALQCACILLYHAYRMVESVTDVYNAISQKAGRLDLVGKNLCAARPGDAGGVCRRAGGHAPAAF